MTGFAVGALPVEPCGRGLAVGPSDRDLRRECMGLRLTSVLEERFAFQRLKHYWTDLVA